MTDRRRSRAAQPEPGEAGRDDAPSPASLIQRSRRAIRRWRLGPCQACGARRLKASFVTDVSTKADPARATRFRILTCAECGHIANPDNAFDYRSYERVEGLPLRARIGTAERVGREYHMAKMALDIVGRTDVEVLVFGAGRSYDNLHIAALPGVRHVAISDIMQLRDDAEFIDASLPAPRQFAVVVASEVVEHFPRPRRDFAHLLSYVEPEGLLVCSTNLYDGGRLGRQHYLFLNGHVTYYTAESVARLAAANGFHLDIRIPLVATGYGGPRKRYLLLTASDAVKASIDRYFSTREYAPSESPTANLELAEAIRASAGDAAAATALAVTPDD